MEIDLSTLTQEWHCDQIRLSAFWREQHMASDDLLWESVTGQQPESQQRQPKTGAAAESGRLANGAALIKNGALNRIDWLLFTMPEPYALEPKEMIRLIPTLPEPLLEFSKLIFEKASAAYSPVRVAIGLTAMRPFRTRAAAYADLAKFVPKVSVPLENASDFLYQINRPRESLTAPGFTINRISRWLAVTPVAVGQQTSSADGEPNGHASRVELDISTTADRTEPISAEDQRALYYEMASLAVEILQAGDIP